MDEYWLDLWNRCVSTYLNYEPRQPTTPHAYQRTDDGPESWANTLAEIRGLEEI